MHYYEILKFVIVTRDAPIISHRSKAANFFLDQQIQYYKIG